MLKGMIYSCLFMLICSVMAQDYPNCLKKEFREELLLDQYNSKENTINNDISQENYSLSKGGQDEPEIEDEPIDEEFEDDPTGEKFEDEPIDEKPKPEEPSAEEVPEASQDQVCQVAGCSNQRKSGYNYCSVHNCRVFGCKNRKKDGGEYCEDHTCLICLDQKKEDSKFCENHNCIEPNCTNQRKQDINKNYGEYCYSHSCKLCLKRKLENGNYCEDHSCSKRGCTNLRKVLGQVTGEYCVEHSCELCLNLKKYNGKYCREHSCTESSCTNLRKKMGNDIGLYCMEHSCKVCLNRKQEGGNACSEHSCQIPGCANLKESKYGYCSKHCCQIEDCPNPRQLNRNYCYKHLCKVEDCRNPKQYGKDYCEEHCCKSYKCRGMALNNGYCEQHQYKCSESSCKNRLEEKGYCPQHQYKCLFPDCQARLAEEDSYCKKHQYKCVYPNCSVRYEHSSSFCPEHKYKCTIEDCQNRIPNASGYCNEHKYKCSEKTCQNRIPNNSYCSQHQYKCQETKCQVRLVTPGYCPTHRPKVLTLSLPQSNPLQNKLALLKPMKSVSTSPDCRTLYFESENEPFLYDLNTAKEIESFRKKIPTESWHGTAILWRTSGRYTWIASKSETEHFILESEILYPSVHTNIKKISGTILGTLENIFEIANQYFYITENNRTKKLWNSQGKEIILPKKTYQIFLQNKQIYFLTALESDDGHDKSILYHINIRTLQSKALLKFPTKLYPIPSNSESLFFYSETNPEKNYEEEAVLYQIGIDSTGKFIPLRRLTLGRLPYTANPNIPWITIGSIKNNYFVLWTQEQWKIQYYAWNKTDKTILPPRTLYEAPTQWTILWSLTLIPNRDTYQLLINYNIEDERNFATSTIKMEVK